MPWTTADVDSHKKGLTDKQKKQWVRIANSVLKRCIAKGGTDKTCAPSAIKQANGAVMNTNDSKEKYIVCKSKQTLDYEPKLTIHQEKAHLVIPVVMMVEGVHNGSQGPLLHEINELGKFPDSWNGIPVVIYHPEKEGEPISANSPEIIDTRTVGRVYNTNVEDKKLKAEVWLDEDKLNSISENTLQAINDSKEVEVSLGMFTENEEKEGDYEGEKYEGIAHNHRPDHLAILPDQVGACSCEDGCGIGANQKEKMTEQEMITKLRPVGYAIEQIGNNSDEGYNERMRMVYDKLRSIEPTNSKIYYYLEEMFDDYLIYTKEGDNNRVMYKQSYKIESGKIEFVGDAIEVHKKVEYIINVGDLSRTKFKKEVKMPKNECPKCLEKINKVLANKESGFDEADREWLEVLTEPQLDKAIKVKEVEKIVEKKVEVNNLTDTQKAALAFGEKQLKERREKMTKVIQDNASKETWPDEKLKEMDDDTLERVFDSVKKDEMVDYSLQNGRITPAGGEEEPPLLNVELRAKKEDKK